MQNDKRSWREHPARELRTLPDGRKKTGEEGPGRPEAVGGRRKEKFDQEKWGGAKKGGTRVKRDAAAKTPGTHLKKKAEEGEKKS